MLDASQGEEIRWQAGFASSSTGPFALFDHTLPRHMRTWMTTAIVPSHVEGLFDGVYAVNRVELALSGSRLTTDKGSIRLLGRLPDGSLRELVALKGVNVMYGAAGEMNLDDLTLFPVREGFEVVRHFIAPLVVQLGRPLLLAGLRIEHEGHGGFIDSDLRVYGGDRKTFIPTQWMTLTKRIANDAFRADMVYWPTET